MAVSMDFLPVFGVILAIVAIVYGDRKSMEEDQIKVAEFDVKPGAGRQSFEDKWDDFTCTFTYLAQGGTKEQWVLGVTRSKDQTEYACSIERPGGTSYLFFEEFKVELDAPGLEIQSADLEKGTGVKLKNSEYVFVRPKNQVFQWDGKFESQLSKIEVYATKAKQEL